MLTKADADRAQPRKTKYFLPDGDGLSLKILPSGEKRWVVSYWVKGVRKVKTLGAYPAMSITKARQARNKLKTEVQARREHPEMITFGDLAQRWLAEYSAGLAEGTRYTHALYVSYTRPLHGKALSDIKRADLVELLEQVQRVRSYSTACRVAVTIGQMYEYALNKGVVSATPAMRLSSALIASKEERRVEHFAAVLDAGGIGKLLRALAHVSNPLHRLALMFAAYTFPRSGELRLAEWSEVEGDVWHIPAEHTKRRKEHFIPLSRQALGVLARIPDSHFGLIFKGRGGKPMSKATLLLALQRLRGLPDDERPDEMTVHGFRAMASTILNESGLWTPDAIERQLSHSPEDEVRAAYNRGDYWAERVRMMQWYADKLDELRAPQK